MHFVAQVQARLDFLTGVSTFLMRMPSERKENKGEKVRAKREGGRHEEAERH